MTVRRRRSDRSGRSKLHSPGRPDSARREELVRFWAAIATGRSSEDAARDAGVSPPVGSRWFRRPGGMPPSHLSQSAKPLSGRYLSFEEREEIALLRAQGRGLRHIACRLERAPSTISREVRRNAATRSGGLDYRATTAQWHADRSAKRPKPAKLATNEALRRYVQDRLAGRISAPDGTVIEGPRVVWNGRRHGPRQRRRWARAWSPEQIAHRLRIDYPGDGPEDQAMRISHEAIYQALYVQGRGALRRELTACLRTGRALRVPRARSRRRGKSFVTPEIMISERSAEAADRAVPGHWEGDLIIGLGRSAIGTLVERAKHRRRSPARCGCNAATRSGGLDYRATTAQWHADRSAKRPKPAKLATNEALRRYVQDRLAGRIPAPDGTVIEGPSRRLERSSAWAAAAQAMGQGAGVLSRSRTVFGSTILGTGPRIKRICGSVMTGDLSGALRTAAAAQLRRELTACLRTGRALRRASGT